VRAQEPPASDQPVKSRSARAADDEPLSRSKRRSLLGVLLVGLLVVAGLVASAPASEIDRRPRLLAALVTITPSPTASPTSTLPPTQTATPLASDTPTITVPPTATIPPTITPTPTDTPTPTPLPTPDSRDREFWVPILMYHYISVPPEDADVYRVDLSVTPEHFREQMDWLHASGYQTISLYDLIYALNIGWPHLPDRPIILTFDDGYLDNYQNAFPVLQEYGYTGTFFILTDVTDRGDPNYMTWDMYREMAAAGMDIEVHGREHVEMSGRDRDWLIYHLLGAAQTIEGNLSYQPRLLSYPSGKYDDLVIDMAREMGYWGAVTTINGTEQTKDGLFELRRLRIRGEWSLETFIAVVTGS
jgi:peptidoglycan/xylan/chitin deacetylase (PgdA/CDA1 family)